MTLAQAQQPLVFIVSGPSGSGKSTLVQKMLEVPGTMFSVSCTTRPPRATESAGKWYDFIIRRGIRAQGSRRGISGTRPRFRKASVRHAAPWLDEAQRKGLDLVLEIDVQGAEQVKQKLPHAVAIFILPPAKEELERRLRARGQDSEEAIERRLERARQEMQRYAEYDFLVVNDDVERAGREVQAITVAARCLRSCLSERARKILESFGG